MNENTDQKNDNSFSIHEHLSDVNSDSPSLDPNEGEFNQLYQKYYEINNQLAGKDKTIKDLMKYNDELKNKLKAKESDCSNLSQDGTIQNNLDNDA